MTKNKEKKMLDKKVQNVYRNMLCMYGYYYFLSVNILVKIIGNIVNFRRKYFTSNMITSIFEN